MSLCARSTSLWSSEQEPSIAVAPHEEIPGVEGSLGSKLEFVTLALIHLLVKVLEAQFFKWNYSSRNCTAAESLEETEDKFYGICCFLQSVRT